VAAPAAAAPGAERGGVTVDEVAPGLWRWTAPHPEWKEGDDWERDVGCVYYEAPDATVLVDPLVPGDEERGRFYEALDRDVERRGLPVAVLLTCEWHRRSTDDLVERYGAEVGALPREVLALPFEVAEETMYWLPEHAALVTGDVLLGDGGGLRICPDSWLDGDAPGVLRQDLRALLDLPIERVLVSHGAPVLADGRAALVRALADDSL
jgi:glyoxylase-like metal-dependent hydrolase (beta-lactamase superfamily II)